jgi:DNA-binding MarR family transcriptional regulator
MLDALKRVVAFCVGTVALMRKATYRHRARSKLDAATFLRELASEKSATVRVLSSRAKVSEPAALTILVQLEENGLVKLSTDKGAEHARMAAITDAGRRELERLHS